MSLDRFKCVSCQLIPDGEVHQCRNHHHACENCFTKIFGVCTCLENLSIKMKNPVIQELNRALNECRFKDLGCTWRFNMNDMDKHIKECKYRLYQCIGKTLGVWQCPWLGLQSQLKEHMHQAHPICEENFSYFQEGCVPFNPDETTLTLNLADAFNKQFIFFYNSSNVTKIVSFIIFVLGRKEDAGQYFYEFEIKAPNQTYSKIKFICECHSDTEDITQLIQNEQSVAVSHRTIANYLHDSKIHFRFILKRKDEDKESRAKATEKIETPAPPPKTVPVAVAKAAVAFAFPNKGKLKQNTSRKGLSIPTATTTVASAVSAATATTAVTKQFSRMISDPTPVRPSLPFMRHVESAQDFSSINKADMRSPVSQLEEAPCYQPSINKRERKISDCKSNNCCSITSDESQISMSDKHILKQPYKMINHHGMYLQKYPASCLNKPRVKK